MIGGFSLFQEIIDSGLYHVDKHGRVWTKRIPKMHKRIYEDRWTLAGNRTGEYLAFKWRGRCIYNHVFVWCWFNGELPEDWEVDHLDTDNFNNHPDNLEAVTKQINQLRRWERRPELREQHSQIFTGRVFSEESRKRMSESAVKRWHG